MKNWYIFYISLLFALLVNGYFGIYNENWIYAESINMFGISVLCFANAYEYFSKKKKKWENAIFVGIVDQKYGIKLKRKKPVEVVKGVGEVGTIDI